MGATIESRLPGRDLSLRVASGTVLALVGLGAVHAGGGWFVALVTVIAFLLVYEWDRIAEGDGLGDMARLHGAFVGAALAVGVFGLFAVALGVVAVGAAVSWWFAAKRGLRRPWPVLAVPYVALPCLSMLWLRFDAEAGTELTYWLLVSIWATDTGAYAAGRTIGGPKLAPRISPKKTWAGLIGGVAAAIVAGGLTAWIVGLPDPLAFALVSGIVGAWSQLGDLSESAVKRHFGVKDSSNLIPGHGGFLDRLDGLLFAAPAAALAVLVGAL
ncbi:phosphatidate cytidylyltransferase [Zavarzinia compransoris]|uniref:Phosphatidate cytidylyltransferase n=1 Tax=Zavarzinia compransoris TaxID=1264899 RepID=A0A317E9N2_9PROT|nr:phosphatidate cytidylyltransferase [Zavarzinia compransoris]PWR23837.1 phosphatidate cytidylyltransferase [Zavarzinia compransoris]TDP48072.1 phosphatidate cytidylyltransferase [Zavarzinia compransoris]